MTKEIKINEKSTIEVVNKWDLKIDGEVHQPTKILHGNKANTKIMFEFGKIILGFFYNEFTKNIGSLFIEDLSNFGIYNQSLSVWTPIRNTVFKLNKNWPDNP